MLWGILICTLKRREKFLDRLLTVLNPQITPDVHIEINLDNGQKTIGDKRNELVRSCQAEYVSMVDDDDLVSTNYVELILQAIKKAPDCVGIEGTYTKDGKNPKKFQHSIRHDRLFVADNVLYRYPNHWNPIRRELALQSPYPSISFGEDEIFAENVNHLLKTEEFVPHPLYHYDYRSLNPDRKFIIGSKYPKPRT